MWGKSLKWGKTILFYSSLAPYPNLPRRFYLKHQWKNIYSIISFCFFKDSTRTEVIVRRQNTEDRRHTKFLSHLRLLCISQNKETNANQAVGCWLPESWVKITSNWIVAKFVGQIKSCTWYLQLWFILHVGMVYILDIIYSVNALLCFCYVIIYLETVVGCF